MGTSQQMPRPEADSHVDRLGWSPPRRSTRSILVTELRPKLIRMGVGILSSLAVVVIIGGIILDSMTEVVESQAQKQQRLISQQIISGLQSTLSGTHGLLEQLIPASNSGGLPLAIWRQALKTTAPTGLVSIYKTDSQGKYERRFFVAEGYELDLSVNHSHPPPAEPNTYTSLCHKCMGKWRALSIHVPMNKQDVASPYLAAALDLNSLYAENVAQIEQYGGGQGWIIDSDSVIVGAANQRLMGLSVSSSNIPWLQELMENHTFEEDDIQRATVMASGPEGKIEPHLAAFTLKRLLDRSFLAVTLVNRRTVTSVLRSTTYGIGGLSALLLIGVIINSIIGLVIDGRQRIKERARVQESIVGLVTAMEARDRYTRGHSENVAYYATKLAEHLELPFARLERIYLGGLLHDLGKIGIRDNILHKPGKLSAEEFDTMKQHPCLGHKILESMSFLEDIGPMVRHHHERMDGSGYPDGLSGIKIPLEARVVAVADVFDALTTDRPYRDGMKIERAIQVLRAMSGQHLDDELVKAFVEILPVIFDVRRVEIPSEDPKQKVEFEAFPSRPERSMPQS